MVLKEGHLWKEKLEYKKEQFKTKQGWADFLIGSAIWGYITVTYVETVFNHAMDFFSFVGNEWIQFYLSYVGTSVVYTGLGLLITLCILKAFEVFNK